MTVRTRSAYEVELQAVPDAMAAAIEATTGLAEASRVVAAAHRGVVVGRGLNLCTAYETALKITELTGSLMAPYSPADLLHGPIGAVGPEVPVVLVAPDEPASASVLEVAAEAQRRGAPVVLIGPEGTSVDGPVAATVALPTSVGSRGLADPGRGGRARTAARPHGGRGPRYRRRPAGRTVEGHAHDLIGAAR